jgi:hypothetical protein
MMLAMKADTQSCWLRITMAAFGMLLIALPSQGASVSLQEGVGGYSGTEDTYIVNGGYSDGTTQNFGEVPRALVISDHYNPG